MGHEKAREENTSPQIFNGICVITRILHDAESTESLLGNSSIKEVIIDGDPNSISVHEYPLPIREKMYVKSRSLIPKILETRKEWPDGVNLDFLASLPNLKRLTIRGNDCFPPSGVSPRKKKVSLESIARCEHLEQFFIENISGIELDFLKIHTCESLYKLKIINYHPSTPLNFNHFAKSQSLNSILLIGIRGVHDNTTVDLTPFSEMKNLYGLYLHNWNLMGIILPEKLYLRELGLVECGIVTKRMLEYDKSALAYLDKIGKRVQHPLDLNKLRGAKNLQGLDLSGNNITLVDVTFIEDRIRERGGFFHMPRLILTKNPIAFLDVGYLIRTVEDFRQLQTNIVVSESVPIVRTLEEGLKEVFKKHGRPYPLCVGERIKDELVKIWIEEKKTELN